MTYAKRLAHNGHAINAGLVLKLWMWLGQGLLYGSAAYTQKQKRRVHRAVADYNRLSVNEL